MKNQHSQVRNRQAGVTLVEVMVALAIGSFLMIGAIQVYSQSRAAYVINGGASDDGFYYFRCWLIGMGRRVYEAALADPDSLADAVLPGIDAEAEIYAAAHSAWMAVTGRPDTDPYPARNEGAELRGEAWDFDDDEEVRRRLPRLAAIYLG